MNNVYFKIQFNVKYDHHIDSSLSAFKSTLHFDKHIKTRLI